MKNLLLSLPLMLCACATPGTLPLDAATVRTAERVIERHDTYVEADETLTEDGRELALADSANATTLLVLNEVPVGLMQSLMGPVMDRHDNYVSIDLDLDDLERDIYLASTVRLRSLFATVALPLND